MREDFRAKQRRHQAWGATAKELASTMHQFPNTRTAIETLMSAIEGGEVSVTETFRIMFVIEGQDLSKCMDMIARYIIRTAGEPSFDQFRWLHNIWKQERTQGNSAEISERQVS